MFCNYQKKDVYAIDHMTQHKVTKFKASSKKNFLNSLAWELHLNFFWNKTQFSHFVQSTSANYYENCWLETIAIAMTSSLSLSRFYILFCDAVVVRRWHYRMCRKRKWYWSSTARMRLYIDFLENKKIFFVTLNFLNIKIYIYYFTTSIAYQYNKFFSIVINNLLQPAW
jgi:hypothetical protein